MRKVFLFSLTCLAVLSLCTEGGCTKEPAPNNGNGSGSTPGEYVDLGLGSGTKWKAYNEPNKADSVYNFYTYEEAVAAFGDSLPTREQLEELKYFCIWTWTGCGYNVAGPNGNTIYMPAAGYRSSAGAELSINTQGNYWSSTAEGSHGAHDLYFDSSRVSMGTYWSDCGHSVRLVCN